MTTKIKEFTRANVRDITDEIEKALRPIAEKYGVALDRKGRSFYRDSMPVMFQMLVTEKGADGTVISAKDKDFKRHCSLVGLEPDDLGREFELRGETYQITGLNLRAKRFPITGKRCRDGKGFKFHDSDVKRALGRAA